MTKYFKAFKKDATCRGVKFKEGRTYTVEGEPKLCENGYHFCKDLVLTLQYYPVTKCITENLYAEIEVLGETVFEQPHQHKGCTNRLKVLRFLSDEEVLKLVDGDWNSGEGNSGDRNSGDRNSGNYNSGKWNSGNGNSGYMNSGDCNSGNRNSGNRNYGNRNSGNWNPGYMNSGDGNSGDRNSGNRNSGDWNSCDNSSGFLNTKSEDTIQVFNKPCLREVLEDADIPDFFYFESGDDYKQSWQDSYNTADEEDRNKVKLLPNFDAEVFFELTGIDLRGDTK